MITNAPYRQIMKDTTVRRRKWTYPPLSPHPDNKGWWGEGVLHLFRYVWALGPLTGLLSPGSPAEPPHPISISLCFVQFCLSVVLQHSAALSAGRLNAITWPVRAENNGENTKLWNLQIKLGLDGLQANYACHIDNQSWLAFKIIAIAFDP